MLTKSEYGLALSDPRSNLSCLCRLHNYLCWLLVVWTTSLRRWLTRLLPSNRLSQLVSSACLLRLLFGNWLVQLFLVLPCWLQRCASKMINFKSMTNHSQQQGMYPFFFIPSAFTHQQSRRISGKTQVLGIVECPM